MVDGSKPAKGDGVDIVIALAAHRRKQATLTSLHVSARGNTHSPAGACCETRLNSGLSKNVDGVASS
jgi:hypothetical protein